MAPRYAARVAFLFRSRSLSQLLTCIVERHASSWEVTWAADGKMPADFSERTLSAAIERATSQAAEMYAGRPEGADAELQFAIYPWPSNAGKLILDITADGDGLTTRDIQGTGITFHSDSIDAVVADAERFVPNPTEAMLRWIHPIAGLT
jgi:hypothetical protein